MNNYIELTRLGWSDVCLLNLNTGDRVFYTFKQKKINVYSGSYFDDKKTFFACYPTKNEWKIWYKGKEYPLNRDLTISLEIKGENRLFSIKEYGIEIHYKEQEKWLSFGDILSEFQTDEDVDLFYHIFVNYQKEKFYTRLKELEAERQKLKIPDDWWK